MNLPLAAIDFSRDLSARHALTVRAIPAVTWHSVVRARWMMLEAAHHASEACLTAQLRLLAAQMRAAAETPAQGFRHA